MKVITELYKATLRVAFPLHNPYILYSLLEFWVSTSVLGTWYLRWNFELFVALSKFHKQ